MGYLIGPQTFRSDQAPKYTGGVIGMLACFAVSIVLLLCYWVVAAVENRIKDKRTGPVNKNEEGIVESFVDLTDREQEDFRYTT